MLTKWDYRFLAMACDVATWSKDPKTKVGAIVVSPDKRQVGWGFNGFPRGVADDDRLDSATKNELMVHAELNCMLNASASLTGWTMYVTRAPCLQCSLAIVQSGIARVVHPLLEPTSTWYGSCHRGRCVMHEAGVEVYGWHPNAEWFEEYPQVLG